MRQRIDAGHLVVVVTMAVGSAVRHRHVVLVFIWPRK